MNQTVQKTAISLVMIIGAGILAPSTASAVTASGNVNLSLDQAAFATITGTWNNTTPYARLNTTTNALTMAYFSNTPNAQPSADADNQRYAFIQQVWNAGAGSSSGTTPLAYPAGAYPSGTTFNTNVPTGTPGNTLSLPVYVNTGTNQAPNFVYQGYSTTALQGDYKPANVSNLILPINDSTGSLLPAGNIATTYDSVSNPSGTIGFAGTMKYVSDIRFPNGSIGLGQFNLAKVNGVWTFFDDFGGNNQNPATHNSLFQLINVQEDTSGPSLSLTGDLIMGTAQFGTSLTLDAASKNMVIGRLSISAVPVPAAVWLFGSALLGMFGIQRRSQRVA